MPATNLSATLANSARECWLALTDDESSIVGRGDTSVEALAEARRRGVEDPISGHQRSGLHPFLSRASEKTL